MPESSFWDNPFGNTGDWLFGTDDPKDSGILGGAWDYVTDVDFSDKSSSGTGLLEDVGSLFTNKSGDVDFGRVAGGIGALGKVLADTGVIGEDTYLGKLFGGPQIEKMGYQGKIPTYTASRMQVPGTYDPERRPGSAGQRYFTDINFGGGDTSGQAAGLQAMNLANLAQQNRQGQGLAALRAKRASDAAAAATQAAAQPVALAGGGITRLNRGMYLNGATDGMADSIPATIDNEGPAALSDGEFVVPADVVSGLGNGNSDAGAKNLYAMMDKVRQARTGSTQQAPAINPNRMLPMMRG